MSLPAIDRELMARGIEVAASVLEAHGPGTLRRASVADPAEICACLARMLRRCGACVRHDEEPARVGRDGEPACGGRGGEPACGGRGGEAAGAGTTRR